MVASLTFYRTFTITTGNGSYLKSVLLKLLLVSLSSIYIEPRLLIYLKKKKTAWPVKESMTH
ncbi:hypothetical protein KFK09_012010 [Dendrobium nobile]|uniref:Uncharacterized protein n=1 Tax=Dendrobium nobile TaxID=94219 RepID=A0A8T3BGG0_DENNO|nr:hypothetical protein KFK09_012010 [Dendrobium nobile]